MTIYVILGTLLVALVYFTVAALGLGLLFSPLVGLLGFAFFRLLDPSERGTPGHLRVLCAAGLGAALGATLCLAMGVSRAPVWDLIGVFVSAVTASAMYTLFGRGTSERCMRCKVGIRGPAIHCPRCGDPVCSRPTCWVGKHARCVRCHEQGVVKFPLAENWWQQRVGSRVMQGECASCFEDAHAQKLRECGQCHWPTCQRCWDYYNGVCQRCEWVMPDLPPELAPFVKRSKSTKKSSSGSRQPPRAAGARPSRLEDAAQGSMDDTVNIAHPAPKPKRR